MAIFFSLETGRGICATRDITQGTKLVSVGSAFCYTPQTVRSLRPEIPRNLLEHPLECLTMFLLLEDQRGANSSVAPYLASLPRTFTNPLYTMGGVIPEGICSDLDRLLRRQREDLFSGWRVVSAAFECLGEVARGKLKLRQFIWAWFVVATRTLYVRPGEPALVPFLDLLNHSPMAKVVRGDFC